MTYEHINNYIKHIESSALSDELEYISEKELADVLKSFRMYINAVPDELFDECGLLELAAKAGDIPFLTAASKRITEDNIDNLIDIAQENEKTECTAWLMNFKNDNIGFDTSDISVE